MPRQSGVIETGIEASAQADAFPHGGAQGTADVQTLFTTVESLMPVVSIRRKRGRGFLTARSCAMDKMAIDMDFLANPRTHENGYGHIHM